MTSQPAHVAPSLHIRQESGAGHPGAYFATLGPEDVERYGDRFSPLPPLAARDKAEMLADYVRCIDAVDRQNSDSTTYWRTPLAVRDTDKSLLFTGLVELWRLSAVLKAVSGSSNIVLMTSEPGFAAAASSLGRALGWRVTVDMPGPWRQRMSLWRKIAGACRYLMALGSFGLPGLRSVPGPADVVIATVSDLAHLEGGKGPRDLIFGSIPDDLMAKGLAVVMLAQLVGDNRRIRAQSRAAHRHPIRTLKDLTGFIDIAASLLRSISWSVICPPLRSNLGPDLCPLVEADARRAMWRDLPGHMLFERALRRLLRRSPRATILHSFENNAWESVCHDVARGESMRAVGYQHNALLKSQLKLYRNPRRPEPAAIVASGELYRTLLADEFGYDLQHIVAGYAARQSSIYGAEKKSAPPGRAAKILVLLQGSLSSSRLLDLVHETFAGRSDLAVTLRPHPAVPLPQVLRRTRLALQPPFRISTAQSLNQDLHDHDVAVTYGSTAALEAVMVGVPCVIADVGEPITANPLFEKHSLCEVASSPGELTAACARLATLSPEEFSRQHRAALEFFMGAFAQKSAPGVDALVAALVRQ